jgi:hypothetical protein
VVLASAQDQVDRALGWWKEQEGRDALLLVHLMDPHLPYDEPKRWRRLFPTQAAPEVLGERFFVEDVLAARMGDYPAAQQYIRDRYDNSIRYADDQLARLFGALRDEDLLVYLSDHGEEFSEHGGFEPGHTLYDELLRIPLLLRAPGLSARRVDAPYSRQVKALRDCRQGLAALADGHPPPRRHRARRPRRAHCRHPLLLRVRLKPRRLPSLVAGWYYTLRIGPSWL